MACLVTLLGIPMNQVASRTVYVADEVPAIADDALITTSRDNLVLSWNSGAERLTGYRAHEVIGKNLAFLFPPKHRENDALNSRDAISGVVVRNSVVKALGQDGRLVSLIYTITPMRDRDGRVIGLLRICKDVSSFKSAQLALRKALEQLRRMDRVEDGVLKAMVGEQPLGAMTGPIDPVAAESRRSHDGFLRILSEECRQIGETLQEINALLQHQ